MRGRKPSGPAYVDRLEGSPQAKERAKVLLDTLTGTCRVQEACVQLGISEPRFQQIRVEMLQAAVAALEPRPAGRPARPVTPEQEQLAALEQKLERAEVDLQGARIREEVALGLPAVVSAPTTPTTTEKKTRRRHSSRRSHPKRAGP